MATRILGFRVCNLHRLHSTASRMLSSISESEQLVIDSLADLLPFVPPPIPKPVPVPAEPPPSRPETKAAASLSPDERLRGIFLQRPVGRAALEAALSATGVGLTPIILADVVNNGNLNGEKIVAFFDWAVKQPGIVVSVETCNVVLSALGRRKFVQHFDLVLQRMADNQIAPDSNTLQILMDSFVAARRVQKAVDLFQNLEAIGAKQDLESFNLLLRCLCQRSHVGVANSLFKMMKGRWDYNIMTYNALICGWVKLGKPDKVEAIIKVMEEAQLEVGAESFTHLIEALGRAGRQEDAIVVYNKMEEKGLAPKTATYNALISNFISSGDLESCVGYFKDMCDKNCSPDIVTYSKLIFAFLKVRRVADALEMFDEMLRRGILPSTTMVTSFIKILCAYGPPHAALMIYKKSRKVGCRISLKAYKMLLGRLSRFGKSGIVMNIWEEMQDNGYLSDKEVYECVVNGLCNAGKLDKAVFVVEESLRHGVCIGRVVYSKLNHKLMETDRVETAYLLFKKMKSARAVSNSLNYSRSKGWHF